MRTLRSLQQALLSAAMLLAAAAASAAPIELFIPSPDRVGVPGEALTFAGTVTNHTGAALPATGFFLDFSGFDPVNVSFDQLLGVTSSFVVADNATSPLVDLFTFTLAPTAGVGTYPAWVVLQTSADVSDLFRVSVTVVPEPSSAWLLAIGLAGILLLRRCTRRRLALPALLGVLFTSQAAVAQVSAAQFVTAEPGLARVGSTLLVALPIANGGTVDAAAVTVTGAAMRTAPLTSPATFPVTLGTIGPGSSRTFELAFDSSALLPGTPYLLTVRGTYQVGASIAGFTVNRFINVPSASPGSGTVKTGFAPSVFVTGAPFPPRPPRFDDEVNAPRPPIPTGPFVAGERTALGTATLPFERPPGITSRVVPEAAIVFNANRAVGLTGAGTNCNPGVAPASCAEPSGASGGGVVFVTANWTAAYSTDGGNTFTTLNPTTVFPADAIGFCCDQVVQYVPSIDRFVWLLQGNGMRIAVASPADIRNSGGTAWTYWNLGPGVFGQPAGTGFDYPDMSVGTNNLYLSWDVGFPACPAGCNSGLEVVRIPLSQLQAGGTIVFDYTTPSDSSLAWGSHLTQNTGNEIFWAGHDGNSALRVFSLAEGSNTYFWRNVSISSWPNNTLSSTTPDRQDWLRFGFPGNSVIGATRTSSNLWFAWTAGTNNSFRQPHVQMVALDRSRNFARTQQVQIWNDSYAFAYPALATNVCTDEVGLSLGYGGNGNYENHVVGIWGDFVVYVTTASNLGVNRYGDYMTIRQNPISGLFDAFGYGISSGTGGVMQSDVRDVVFGRSCQIR